MKYFSQFHSHQLTDLLLKTFLVFAFLSFFYSESTASSNSGIASGERDALVLNPAFKVKRMSTGVVIAYSNQTGGKAVMHEFENLYADVLLGAVRKQSVNQLIPILARKYYFEIDECRREIKHAVHVLEEWEILVSNDVLP
ncbi:MAG: hypothetical protein JW723_10160 [Bacteroidales bacterium]|nr:hypothetical protein [Bacteroidales bacterium]